MEQLILYFTQAGFTGAEAAQIAGCFTFRKIPKGDFFIEEGKISRHLGFVEQGFLQYFVIVEGEEKTTYSVGHGNFVASLVSFLKQVPSKESIRALVDTSLWLIDKNTLKKIQKDIPAFAHFYIELLEWQICCIDESRLDSLLLNAAERYKKMLDKEPSLIQQIPLQYLASILGVTPRHLSRIRNSIR